VRLVDSTGISFLGTPTDDIYHLELAGVAANEVLVDGKNGDDHVYVQVHNPAFAVTILDSDTSSNDVLEILELTTSAVRMHTKNVKVGTGGNFWIDENLDTISLLSSGKVEMYDVRTNKSMKIHAASVHIWGSLVGEQHHIDIVADDSLTSHGESILAAKQGISLSAGAALGISEGTRLETPVLTIQGRDVTFTGRIESAMFRSGHAIHALSYSDLTAEPRKQRAVMIVGEKVIIGPAASIDTSGIFSAGLTHIGGNLGGADGIPAADTIVVERGSEIYNDAILWGHGGFTVLWADNVMHFNGNISARSGLLSGTGGFAEVSGKHGLGFDGKVSLQSFRSPTNAGMLLLDPDNLYLHDGGHNDGNGGGGYMGNTISAGQGNGGGNGGNVYVTISSIETGLAGNNNIDMRSSGEIQVTGAIQRTSNPCGQLYLNAAGNLGVSGTIDVRKKVSLVAGNVLTISSSVTSRDDSVYLTAVDISMTAAVSSGNADVNIYQTGSSHLCLGSMSSTTNCGMQLSDAEIGLITASDDILFYDASRTRVEGLTYGNTAQSGDQHIYHIRSYYDVYFEGTTNSIDENVHVELTGRRRSTISFADGHTLNVSPHLTLQTSSGTIVAAGALTLSSENGIVILNAFTSTGSAGAKPIVLNADNDSDAAGATISVSSYTAGTAGVDSGLNQENGVLTIWSTRALNTNNNLVTITAFDVDIDGSINSGTDGISIHGSVASQTMWLGDSNSLSNVAQSKPSRSYSGSRYSSGAYPTYKIVDGNANGDSFHHGDSTTANQWYEIDLQSIYYVNYINVIHRSNCCPERIEGAVVKVSTSASFSHDGSSQTNTASGTQCGTAMPSTNVSSITLPFQCTSRS